MVGEGSVETEKIKNLEWGFFKMKRGKRGDCEEEESVVEKEEEEEEEGEQESWFHVCGVSSVCCF